MEAFRAVQHRLGLSCIDYSSTSIIEPFVFISIDLEFSPKCITQLGISTFDVQTLASADLECCLSNEHGILNERPITNEYPISSVLHSTKVNKYTERRRKPSHFGKRQVLVPTELASLPRGILSPVDEQGHPREVVLVGHNISNDLRVIKDLSGLDIYEVSSVKTILDTQDTSQESYRTRDPLSLKRLLLRLGLEYVGLHNAAHDSRYTLRALLLMLCETAPAPPRDWHVEQRLAVLEKIARFHERRGRVTRCESPRVRYDGSSDVLDREFDDSDGGILSGLIQPGPDF